VVVEGQLQVDDVLERECALLPSSSLMQRTPNGDGGLRGGRTERPEVDGGATRRSPARSRTKMSWEATVAVRDMSQNMGGWRWLVEDVRAEVRSLAMSSAGVEQQGGGLQQDMGAAKNSRTRACRGNMGRGRWSSLPEFCDTERKERREPDVREKKIGGGEEKD
jgi:hypothetical protein